MGYFASGKKNSTTGPVLTVRFTAERLSPPKKSSCDLFISSVSMPSTVLFTYRSPETSRARFSIEIFILPEASPFATKPLIPKLYGTGVSRGTVTSISNVFGIQRSMRNRPLAEPAPFPTDAETGPKVISLPSMATLHGIGRTSTGMKEGIMKRRLVPLALP